jgi:hypothetical protein
MARRLTWGGLEPLVLRLGDGHPRELANRRPVEGTALERCLKAQRTTLLGDSTALHREGRLPVTPGLSAPTLGSGRAVLATSYPTGSEGPTVRGSSHATCAGRARS